MDLDLTNIFTARWLRRKERYVSAIFCQILLPVIQLIGFALFFFTYSTWEGKCVFMEDLYVQPEQRGKGIGTKVKDLMLDIIF